MTKRINSIYEIPTWFNLAKYDFTKSLDSLGWFKQLYIRGLHFIKAGKFCNTSLIETDYKPMLKTILQQARDNPNLFIDDYAVLSASTMIYKGSPSHTQSEHFQINCDFSDNFLIENFKRYLANIRKKHKSIYRTPLQKTDFNNWVKFSVLPYIDLFMWATEEQKHITSRVMAHALYPNGEKGEETIRKTTIPLVEEIYSQYTMVQLYAQSSFAIQEKNFT